MWVLYCKLPGKIREGAGMFSDETSSMDSNRICWKTRDYSVLLYKPARATCGEGDVRRAVCFHRPHARCSSE